MPSLSSRLRLGLLAQNERAVVLTEFAFAAPFLLIMGLLGLELVNYMVVHQKASQTAVLVADSAARKLVQIDERDIEEIFFGAQVSGQTVDIGANGRIVLTMLTDNGRSGEENGDWIRWQRCYGQYGEDRDLASQYGKEGDGAGDNSLASGIGPEGAGVQAFPGGPAHFVEVYLDYKPLFLFDNDFTKRIFGTRSEVYYSAAIMVREREIQSIANQTDIPEAGLWTCDRFDKLDVSA